MASLDQRAYQRFREQYRDTVFTLGSFWRFRDGAWRALPLPVLRTELCLIYADFDVQLPSRQLARLLDQFALRLAQPASAWNLDPALLPCRNGLLHLETRQIAPHPASVYQARTVAAAYDPSATAPVWDSFLAGTVPAAAAFLQEFAGLALTFDPRYEVAVWLNGPPGSGKSTFLAGLQAMLGERAGQLDLLTLARRRLAPAQLFGRSLLLSAEQPPADLEHDNLLNALISGEPLLSQPHAGSPSREPDFLALQAKWIWAMVSLPRFNRSTSGLYRRVRLVPFPRAPRPTVTRRSKPAWPWRPPASSIGPWMAWSGSPVAAASTRRPPSPWPASSSTTPTTSPRSSSRKPAPSTPPPASPPACYINIMSPGAVAPPPAPSPSTPSPPPGSVSASSGPAPMAVRSGMAFDFSARSLHRVQAQLNCPM